MADDKIPSLSDLQQFDVNRRGQYEGIRQSLYDFQTYAAAGQTQLQFFQTPQGQDGKSVADTNMLSAGQLPQPVHFLVQSIELMFFPGTLPGTTAAAAAAPSFGNDVFTVLKSGSLRFFIGSKAYLEEAPLGRFPPKTRMESESGLSGTFAAGTFIASDYAAFAGRPYFMTPPVLLVPNQNFSVTLNWPAVVALPSTVAGRIGCILDGILYRQSQ